jgi:hypothetical protein
MKEEERMSKKRRGKEMKYQDKFKSKVFPMLNYLPRHDNKLGNGGIAPRNLNLDTGDD